MKWDIEGVSDKQQHPLGRLATASGRLTLDMDSKLAVTCHRTNGGGKGIYIRGARTVESGPERLKERSPDRRLALAWHLATVFDLKPSQHVHEVLEMQTRSRRCLGLHCSSPCG